MNSRIVVCVLAAVSVPTSVVTAWADGQGPFDRIRVGVSAHGVGPKENSTFDLNGELVTGKLYTGDPNASSTPALHVGANLNSGGKTSTLYGGATFTGPLGNQIYWEGDIGPAIHTETSDKANHANLGNCSVTFRGQGLIGFQVTQQVDVATGVEHYNSMGMCGADHAGLTNVVAKVGYKF